MSQQIGYEKQPLQFCSIFLSLTDKASKTNTKPFKINSTRNADVLNKASVVIAAKF